MTSCVTTVEDVMSLEILAILKASEKGGHDIQPVCS